MLIEIQPLNELNMDVYLACGSHPQDEKISEDQRLRMEAKRLWAEAMIPRGLGARVAFLEDYPAGFAEFVPIELAPAPVKGENLLFVTDIHVTRDDKGGKINLEHLGIGRLLVRSVEQYAREKGFKGMVTLALKGNRLPEAFYESVGFRLLQQIEDLCLLWYPFSEECDQPIIWKGNFKPHIREDGVQIEVIRTTQCPGLSSPEVWRSVADEYDDAVSYSEFDADSREVMDIDCVTGCAGVFVNGNRVSCHCTSTEEIRGIIDRELGKLHRAHP